MTTIVTVLTFCAILGAALWIGKIDYLKRRKKYLDGLRAGDKLHVSTARGIEEAVFVKRYANCEAKAVLVKLVKPNELGAFKITITEGQIISQ